MIVVKTSLRISLFGGSTDFYEYFDEYGGEVITTAIDKFVYTIIKKRFDDNIRLGYSKTELVSDANQLEHELAREAIRMIPTKGIEISTMADVPGGTGLGSSSAVTVGFLHALLAYHRELFDEKTTSISAIQIEVMNLKKPIGFQDQIIAAYGGFKNIVFNKNSEGYCSRSFDVKEVATDYWLEGLDKSLLLFYTNITRDSANILDEQSKNVKLNTDILDQIKAICKEAKNSIGDKNWDNIGLLLDQSWELKKQLSSKISDKNLDYLYRFAKANGALGGKITGAGGGGFLLVYCPIKKQKYLIEAMSNIGIREMPFSFYPHGSRVIFNDKNDI